MNIARTAASFAVVGLCAALSLSAQSQGTQEGAAPVARGIGGDIPDSQVFVPFAPTPGDFSILSPEGWACIEKAKEVSFVDKYDGLRVTLAPFAGPLTLARARESVVPAIVNSGRVVSVGKISRLRRKGGEAIVVTFASNSEPNQVTGRQIRLENQACLFYDKGRLAIVTMWAPSGSDNVDQWNLISDSFRWR